MKNKIKEKKESSKSKQELNNRLYNYFIKNNLLIPAITALLTIMVVAPKMIKYLAFHVPMKYLHISSSDISILACELILLTFSFFVVIFLTKKFYEKSNGKYSKIIRKIFNKSITLGILSIIITVVLLFIIYFFKLNKLYSTIILLFFVIVESLIMVISVLYNGVEIYDNLKDIDYNAIWKLIKDKFLAIFCYLAITAIVFSSILMNCSNEKLILQQENDYYLVVDFYEDKCIAKKCKIEDKKINISEKNYTYMFLLEDYEIENLDSSYKIEWFKK